MRNPVPGARERFIAVALGVSLLLGCQTQVKPARADSTVAVVDEVLDLDQELGERAQPNEAHINQRMADVVTSFIERRYSEGRRPALRDAHAKAHGCVRARFDMDAELPQELRHGVFIPGKSYAAWIRFSNSAPEINPDKSKDARGMAIKLTGVAGEKLLPEERDAQTQDFILINHPFFFVDSPAQYLAMLQAFHEKRFSGRTNLLNTLAAASHLSLHENRLAVQIGGTRIANPLYEQYWSMTPYRLGAGLDKKAVKYFAKPCGADKPQAPGFFSQPETDYLQTAMLNALNTDSACFDFYLQTFKDFASTPIEQSTVEWTEAAAPAQRVARITIPSQKFDSPAQMDFCENLSYTPWHALAEHKPLGAVNRARRVVYTSASKLRHKLNKAPRSEPAGDEHF